MLKEQRKKIDWNKVDWSRFTVLVVMVLMIILFNHLSEHFLTWRNVRNILRQVSMYGICAVGMTFVIMVNGVDLSMSSTIGVASVACVMMCNMGIPLWLNILICIIIGMVIGMGNGFFINEVGMFPMMATITSKHPSIRKEVTKDGEEEDQRQPSHSQGRSFPHPANLR